MALFLKIEMIVLNSLYMNPILGPVHHEKKIIFSKLYSHNNNNSTVCDYSTITMLLIPCALW